MSDEEKKEVVEEEVSEEEVEDTEKEVVEEEVSEKEVEDAETDSEDVPKVEIGADIAVEEELKPEKPEAIKPEPEARDELEPQDGEDKDAFLHRYMNHYRTLRKIAQPYRRAAAEKVWKDAHSEM